MDTGAARFEARLSQQPPRRAEHWQQPLMLWALVLAVAMLSFYVHILNDHVMRNDAQRAARSHPAAPGAQQFAANAPRTAPAVRAVQTASR